MWVIEKNEHGLFMVGFYDPKGTWRTYISFNTLSQAEEKVHYLNGGDVR
jgi:hypothetical protein